MFKTQIIRLDSVGSTNNYLKELADCGAAEGTVVIADAQTDGRGTGDRCFFSPAGEGLYLSLLLRPKVNPEELFTLTARAATAVRRGIEAASGAPCTIKWLNDIYLNGRKVCGILAELSPRMDYVVMGIGVNVKQCTELFEKKGLSTIATSLEEEGYVVEREELGRCILEELSGMYRQFPGGREACLREYRAHCTTLGRQVEYWINGVPYQGIASGIDENFSLVVGGRTVRSGTVYFK